MDETTTDPTTAPTPARPTFSHRVLGWRGVAAVALASVILGGAGGAVLGAVSNGADGTTRGPGRRPLTGVPGQLPPTTVPQQDEEGGHNT